MRRRSPAARASSKRRSAHPGRAPRSPRSCWSNSTTTPAPIAKRAIRTSTSCPRNIRTFASSIASFRSSVQTASKPPASRSPPRRSAVSVSSTTRSTPQAGPRPIPMPPPPASPTSRLPMHEDPAVEAELKELRARRPTRRDGHPPVRRRRPGAERCCRLRCAEERRGGRLQEEADRLGLSQAQAAPKRAILGQSGTSAAKLLLTRTPSVKDARWAGDLPVDAPFRELSCPCRARRGAVRPDVPNVVRISTAFGVITSAFRSPAHNKAVGGVPNSYHLQGRAIDIVPSRCYPPPDRRSARTAGYNPIECSTRAITAISPLGPRWFAAPSDSGSGSLCASAGTSEACSIAGAGRRPRHAHRRLGDHSNFGRWLELGPPIQSLGRRPLNPCAMTYHSEESLRLAGGLACFTVVKCRFISATSWLSAPPASTLAT